jgi:hypothetical protein
MRLCLGTIARLFCVRRSLLLENLALRQQLVVFKRRHPRTRLTFLDKLFWVAACQIWSDWNQFLIVVLPDTVVQWHRSGFALYWRLISRFPGRAGRKRISKEIRDLIFRMVAENPTRGAPRIHAEPLMLGFDVSERTVSRWIRKAPRDPKPAKRWLAFLRNHREVHPSSSRGAGCCFIKESIRSMRAILASTLLRLMVTTTQSVCHSSAVSDCTQFRSRVSA